MQRFYCSFIHYLTIIDKLYHIERNILAAKVEMIQNIISVSWMEYINFLVGMYAEFLST